MFNKNLKYYRLKKNMSKKELASLIGVTPMAVTHYESGARKSAMAAIKAMAEVLGVKVADFLGRRNENLVFDHGEFRKSSKLSASQQEYIREDAEECRFFAAVDILGGEVQNMSPERIRSTIAHEMAHFVFIWPDGMGIWMLGRTG